MFLWRQLCKKLGLDEIKRVSFNADDELIESLTQLAEQQRRPAQAVATDLINDAIAKQRTNELLFDYWTTLTPREQQVTALICMQYTNRQIAGTLGISPQTVKSHIRHILEKFNLNSKAALAQVLKEWDFSAWNR